MSDSVDPSSYRQREQQLIEHVERLLKDDRLRVDTTMGRRPVISLSPQPRKENREVELKRLMDDMGQPDRDLQARMPVCPELTVSLSRTRFLLFRKTVGRLRVICLSPQRELLEGRTPRPLTQHDLKSALATRGAAELCDVPTTFVILSTGGFTLDAHEMVERRADRTLILVEPNDAGGWTVTGPVETKALNDLLDPEADAEKRRRIAQEIDRRRSDLLSSGLGADRLADATRLPMSFVEEELRSYAKDNGLAAKRLDGCVVLFRDGSMAAAAASRSGGSPMPFIERVRSLFSRKGDNEKKVALLSERRAGLSLRRDRAYEEMSVLEQKEAELRQQFKDTTSDITRRRITSQLVQFRKDLERRQQLLGMLNQQINVVATHLHNLELVQQGQTAQLPDSDELAADAASAEQVLADLQASNEMAGSMAAAGPSGLSDEEQTLYEELSREAGDQTQPQIAPHSQEPAAPVPMPRQAQPQAPETPLPPQAEKRPREAEPG